jgi:exopolysaccharide biosynthesis polyprenyl glycosylphosphotransferase
MLVKTRNESMLLLWPALTALADLIALAGSMMAAYGIRFHTQFTSVVPILYGTPPFHVYLISAFVGGAFWVMIMSLRGVYRIQMGQPVSRELRDAVGSFLIGFALGFALLFFYRGFLYSRVVALLTLVIALPALALVRILFGTFRRKLMKERPFHKALLVGSLADVVGRRLSAAEVSGIQILAIHEDKGSAELADIVQEAEELHADTIILAYGFERFARVRQVITAMEGRRFNFLFAPDPQALATGLLRTLNLAGLPMLQLREDPLEGWNGVIKGTFDVVVSTMLLILFSPLMALVTLGVRLSGKGSVIYRQERVSLDGQSFTIYKFRTMRQNAESGSGPVWAKPGDPRTTLFGKFLRRWSLDELPQLWNVLRGDMSLVGPRPERPEFVEEFREKVARYSERHRVRCGLTGWAQVNGLRGQAPIEERTRYDLMYIENWSLSLDLWILARTVLAVLFGRNAY